MKGMRKGRKREDENLKDGGKKKKGKEEITQ